MVKHQEEAERRAQERRTQALGAYEEYDVVVIGAGAAGLECAINLPQSARVLVVCKGAFRESDSYLAQGGICVLREGDFDNYFEDTMRAGHYENNPDTVRCMIENSRGAIAELEGYGVRFQKTKEGAHCYTREGAHSNPRILFHADCTGKEITSRLFKQALSRNNITVRAHTTMLDLVCRENACLGVILRANDTGAVTAVRARATVLATGGVGGLFSNSTNYRILTGDGLAVCYRHGVAVDHANYVQIHPTTLYSERRGRRFLISESVRGEGAHLIDSRGERFVDELLPRDAVTAAIYRKMQEEGSRSVYLDLSTVRGGADTLQGHFPGIVRRLKREGYDPLKDKIPVVPAQHYFMGGIRSDLFGRTTMPRLYAVGETCCNGVHGKNRLASNSLLESVVFAKRAAQDITNRLAESDAARAAEKKLVLGVKTEEYASASKVRAVKREYRARVTKEVLGER